MTDEYILKWILLESKLQYEQEKVEIKETDKRIKELQYNIIYFNIYLEDVKQVSKIWKKLDIENVKYNLDICKSELIKLKEYKKNILENLRNNKEYGLSNTIIIK